MIFDVRKMERPHRSGVIAVCAVYAVMYIAMDLSSIGNFHEGTFKDLVVCHLLPILCIGLNNQEFKVSEVRHYETTKLVYCPKCRVKKRKDEEVSKKMLAECYRLQLICSTFSTMESFPSGEVSPGACVNAFNKEGVEVVEYCDKGSEKDVGDEFSYYIDPYCHLLSSYGRIPDCFLQKWTIHGGKSQASQP